VYPKSAKREPFLATLGKFQNTSRERLSMSRVKTGKEEAR
jgi:hypothetical protein